MRTVVGLDLAPAASGCFAIETSTGVPRAELYVGTDPKENIHVRIHRSKNQIIGFLQAHKPELVVIEDFAFAGRFSSRDIAMHAGVIRDYLVWTAQPFLLIPPTSLIGWVNEELGLQGKPAKSKQPTIEYVTEKMGYKSQYKRKSEYNHTFDAACLAHMGKMAIGLSFGHHIGTPKQRDIFLTEAVNSKGEPKGLLNRPDYYVKPVI